MSESKTELKKLVFEALSFYLQSKGIQDAITEDRVSVEVPPSAEMGDLGIPMFAFAKTFRMAPALLSNEIAKLINDNFSEKAKKIGKIMAVGPYVNAKLNKEDSFRKILEKIKEQKENYGSLGDDGKKAMEGQRVMIEFSAPNTNKPLHLGHLRNDALGESVSRILKKAGAEVYKVDLINDRGIHICKSMLSYKLFHEKNKDTPESLGIKGDRFVGQCYVEFERYLKGTKENPESAHPEAMKMAEELLIKWEQGDKETRELWKMMNDWTLNGIKETYSRTGVSFDKFYLESDTYLLGKDQILKGLEKGVFFKAQDGSVRIDVTSAVGTGKDEDSHEKVLLRKDGTSVYMTQDIGTAISRHEDWQFNRLVYVVASEQIYHFKILFYILEKLGFDWAKKLYHLSYGLVNLPSGRMKSREGTIVDADDLIDSLHKDALDAITEKGRNEQLENADSVAEKVAIAALHYYLLQVTPKKDMLFNPEESLNFNGNTGPYLQYVGARINSILAKAKESAISSENPDFALLKTPEEWELTKALGAFPDTVAKSAENFDPSIMASYLYDVAKLFSKFYQTCPIVNADTKALASARLFLAECTLTVMRNAMFLVLVPFLEKM